MTHRLKRTLCLSLREWLDGEAPTAESLDGNLDLLTKAIRGGQYPPELLEVANRYMDDGERIRKMPGIRNLRARALAAKIYHYFGKPMEAREAIEELGEEAVRELGRLGERPQASEERKRLQQLCWVGVTYAEIVPYRRHEYVRTLEILRLCETTVEEYLKDDLTYPMYGLRAQIALQFGQTKRAQGEYSPAEIHFGEALRLARLRLDTRSAEAVAKEDWERLDAERAFANHFIGLVMGLGLGWIRYHKGLLRLAIPHAEAAYMLLHGTGDAVNRALVLLLLAHIERAAGDMSGAALEGTVKKLQEGLRVFAHGPYRHAGYETRVRYALGNTYLAAGRLPEAEEECSQVAALAEASGDVRWQCNALLLKSRIGMKRDPGSAEILAFAALERAQSAGRLQHVMCEIEALLVRGECRYLRGDLTAAQADILRVKEHYATHLTKRWEAECLLQLARIALRRNQMKEADGYLDQWQHLEKDVEYQAVKELAREVKRERQLGEKNFFIPRDVKDLNFEAHVAELRNFLLERARETSRTKEEIAEKLHISRQTLHNWMKSGGD